MTSTPWLVGLTENPGATVNLICFGSAGSGGSQFRRWNQLAPPWLRIIGVQLPGREERYREVTLRDGAAITRGVVTALEDVPPGTFAFLGHSFGALLAFEVARRLRAQRLPGPVWLCAVSRAAPHLPLAHRKIYHLPDAEFIDVLRRYGGIDDRILVEPELLRFFLPGIRADLEINTEYLYQAEAPLAVPITAVRGIDDPLCSAEELRAWRAQTDGGFAMHECNGAHFFYRDSQHHLIATAGHALAPYAATANDEHPALPARPRL
ncbi:MAG: thioesterase domain-containing protein [Aquisalimonadaceae bacterium]